MDITRMVPIIFAIVVFYFFLIRPQKKKQQEHDLMIANLKKNDEVVTSGGIHATIIGVKDKTFSLRIDDNTKIDVDKLAVAKVKKVR